MGSDAAQDPGLGGNRLALVRDGRWPHAPGVCCWRHGVRVAFAAAGAVVTEITWQPPPSVAPSPARQPPRSTPRMSWLPRYVREPIAVVYRGLRFVGWRLPQVMTTAAGRAAATRRSRRALQELEATLVVAESIAVARAVVATGAAQRPVWALALPAERLHIGDDTGFAAEVAAAADTLDGFLTDSEVARDCLERAAASHRPRVEIFPPLAIDRPCPEHGTSEVPRAESGPAPGSSGAAQLILWRRLIDKKLAGVSPDVPYSFAAARLYGTLAQWAAPARPGWSQSAVQPPSRPHEPGIAQWSAAAQDRAARRVWGAAVPRPPDQPRPVRRALVAGFDLKFAHELAERLGNRSDLDVVVDSWRDLAQGTRLSRARLERAESIFAEWARTSAVWYSQHKRPDQFLAVRLHRFELDSRYPREIVIENVDAVVYIAPLFGRRIRDELGWPVRKLVYIPNFLDVNWLDRPKLPEARFAIGFVGIEWSRKRVDLALDLLGQLRREDNRFHLVVRSTAPWHNEYAWADPEERDYVGRCFERIDRDPWLRPAVVFEEPGRDMARWFRRIGHVISTSDEEGCHTAVGEGMASGAVPVVRPWPGADEVYGKEWIHSTIDDAVTAMLANADAAVWEERRLRARDEIRRTYDPGAVVGAWADLLHGDVQRAKSYFGEYSGPSPGQPQP